MAGSRGSQTDYKVPGQRKVYQLLFPTREVILLSSYHQISYARHMSVLPQEEGVGGAQTEQAQLH
jgi:hypothetical protein